MTEDEFRQAYLDLERLCVSQYERREATEDRREARMVAFWEAFQNVTLEDFTRGLQWFVENSTETTFPRPAHLFEALRASKPQEKLQALPEPTDADRKRHAAFSAELAAWLSGNERSLEGRDG